MRRLGFFLLSILASILFLGSIDTFKLKPAFAASKCDGVIVSELMPNPADPLSDSTDEWIELKNTTDADVDISACKIKDAKGTVREFTIPEQTVISANGFTIFYSRDTKISLNNDTDGVTLLSPEGDTLYQTPDYKNAPAGESFVLNGTAWEWTTDPTPGFEKVYDPDPPPAEENQNTCQGIIISELMPDPSPPQTDSDDEWIEIFNQTEAPVDIGGCILADTYKSGSTHEYQIPGGILAAGGFKVFYSKDTKISLNNADGDSVRLLSPEKKVMFETQNYGKSHAGESWAYDGQSWFWSGALTPGALNVIETIEDQPAPKSPASEVKKKKSSASSSKSKKPATSKAKKLKPLAKNGNSKKKSAQGGKVLGANTENGNKENSPGKINDKAMGYILVTLSAATLVGYVGWINKDMILNSRVLEKIRNLKK